MAWSTEGFLPCTVLLSTFRLPRLKDFLYFCSVVRRMPEHAAKMGHGLHCLSGTQALTKCLPSLPCLGLVAMPLWVQTPESFPNKSAHSKTKNYNKIILMTLNRPSCVLHTRREIVSVSTILKCMLKRFTMPSMLQRRWDDCLCIGVACLEVT